MTIAPAPVIEPIDDPNVPDLLSGHGGGDGRSRCEPHRRIDGNLYHVEIIFRNTLARYQDLRYIHAI